MIEARPFVYHGQRLVCEGADVAALAEQYGTPLYVYSAAQIAERASLFQNRFAAVPHTVCYAVKANSSLAILKLLADMGCGFDIVSGGELARVIAAGGPRVAGRVVFSGVGKTAVEMDAALEAGILLFNVESEPELELLAARAAALGKVARIALRVNPDVNAETHPYISTGLSAHKFGIGIKLARAVYARALAMPSIETAGVSVHIGSQIRQVEPFAEALAKTLALVAELRSDGHDIRYVDAGGGLGIEYGDKPFDAAEQVAQYAEALESALGAAGIAQVHLLLEPGRFLVGQAGALITRVLYRKANGDKKFVIVDAGMNDLIRPALYQAHHEIVPVVRNPDAVLEEADIVGPVCESGDFFARARTLAVTAQGDLLAILDAGAYGLSLSSNYNTRVRPAEVLVEASGPRLVRRRETYAELFAAEIV
jgi:diaminopimelate decarboxylase